MKSNLRPSVLAVVVWLAGLLGGSWKSEAQVPRKLLVHGSVRVGDLPFEGPGRVKVALVDAEGSTTYWSNDGTSRSGDEPAAWVPVVVSGGEFSVIPGDVTSPGMVPVPSEALEHDAVHVRLWFSDGGRPFQHLAPDEALLPVGYAHLAARVVAGSVGTAQLANGAVTASKLATGAVGARHLAAGAAASNLGTSGGLVVSSLPEDPRLLASGLVRVGETRVSWEGWRRLDFPVPPGRQGHATLWTGTELIVIGVPATVGQGIAPLTGFGLDPVSGETFELPKDPVSSSWIRPRVTEYLAEWDVAWTGQEVLLWNGARQTGWRCEPRGKAWTPMGTDGCPSRRTQFAAVWTGAEWVIWGGRHPDEDRSLGSGARYDPATDRWTQVPTNGAPTARYGMVSVRHDRGVILLGGRASSEAIQGAEGVWKFDSMANQWSRLASTGDGSLGVASWGTRAVVLGTNLFVIGQGSGPGVRLNLTTQRWSSLATSTGPRSIPAGARVVATDREVILWGGPVRPLVENGNNDRYETRGYAYEPSVGGWRELSVRGAPFGRAGHSMVWTGREVVVWGGGWTKGPMAADGARYRPDEDRWLPIVVPPLGRTGADVLWTGSELLIWGGTNASGLGPEPAGGRWNPATGRWSAITGDGAPSPRSLHSAIWTGRAFLVWGGSENRPWELMGTGQNGVDTGAIYDPVLDRWGDVTTRGAPARRLRHSAVWTGQEMIVWGGSETRSDGALLFSGGRYDPAVNGWRSTGTILRGGLLDARSRHRAVWTGSEMLVWGGGSTNLGAGLRYDPVVDAWTGLSPVEGLPLASTADPTVVWMGNEMLVFANRQWFRYHPGSDTWRKVSAQGAPAALVPQVVWTGKEVLVWASSGQAAHRYDPASDLWQPMSREGGPPNTLPGHGMAWAGDRLFLTGRLAWPESNLERVQQSLWIYEQTRPVYLYGGK